MDRIIADGKPIGSFCHRAKRPRRFSRRGGETSWLGNTAISTASGNPKPLPLVEMRTAAHALPDSRQGMGDVPSPAFAGKRQSSLCQASASTSIRLCRTGIDVSRGPFLPGEIVVAHLHLAPGEFDPAGPQNPIGTVIDLTPFARPDREYWLTVCRDGLARTGKMHLEAQCLGL